MVFTRLSPERGPGSRHLHLLQPPEGAGLNLDKTRKLFCAHEAGEEILQIVGNEVLHLSAKYRGRESAAKKKEREGEMIFRELKRAIRAS